MTAQNKNMNSTEVAHSNLPQLDTQRTFGLTMSAQEKLSIKQVKRKSSFYEKNNEMVSAALLDQQYVMVEESVVDDNSKRTN